MRTFRLALLGAFCGVAAALPANAAHLPHRTEIVLQGIVNIAQGCGRGYHWVPAGYARRGKWRDGHCAPN
jgi:hypothetical protein